MIAGIIGCGQTSEGWQNTRHDFTIGVNDCKKFGHDPDYMVVIDSPKRFTKDRIEIMKATKSKLITRDDQWKHILGESEKVRLQHFGKYLKKGHVYNSKTSTFVAMSIAFNMGANDIVLHGVDLVSHQVFHPGNRLYDYEMRQYEKFCRMLRDIGVRVWVSSHESALAKFLNVYKPVNIEYHVSEESINKATEILQK